MVSKKTFEQILNDAENIERDAGRSEFGNILNQILKDSENIERDAVRGKTKTNQVANASKNIASEAAKKTTNKQKSKQVNKADAKKTILDSFTNIEREKTEPIEIQAINDIREFLDYMEKIIRNGKLTTEEKKKVQKKNKQWKKSIEILANYTEHRE